MRLFGLLAEKAGAERLHVQAADTDELRSALEARIAGLDGLCYAIAVNRQITKGNEPLGGGEEIALLPPFAGG